MFARVYSAVVSGPTVVPVTVEVVGSNTSLPTVSIIGLAHASVLESKDRVFSALRSLNQDLPRKRIVVSLRPVDVPKSGSSLDLAIALGILMVQGKLPLEPMAAVGELGLDGALYGGPEYPALLTQLKGQQRIYGPLFSERLNQFGLSLPNLRLGSNLSQIYSDAAGLSCLISLPVSKKVRACVEKQRIFIEQKINPNLLTAMSLSLAGGHHLLLFGSPGSGKTYSRHLLQQLMPAESESDQLGRQIRAGLWRESLEGRLVSPHHSASVVGLVGGGQPVRPGAITQAHQGFLFMDEIPEFPKPCLEALRQPLESDSISIVRGSGSWTLPCSFTMVATANPCPCGYFGEDICQCTPKEVDRYLDRISGPILDRIDLQLRVTSEGKRLYTAKQLRQLWRKISRARLLQQSRVSKGFPRFARSYEKDHLKKLGQDFKFPLSAELVCKWSVRRWLKYWRVLQTLEDLEGGKRPQDHALAFQLVRPSIGPGQS